MRTASMMAPSEIRKKLGRAAKVTLNQKYGKLAIQGPAYFINSDQLCYLAQPISHSKHSVVSDRVVAAHRSLATLTTAGYSVYSPCTHWFTTARCYRLPKDWSFWEKPSLMMLGRCDVLIVLKLKGWEKSEGVAAEIQFARDCMMPILAMIDPSDAKSLVTF